MGQRNVKSMHARRAVKARFCERMFLLAFANKIAGLPATASRACPAWRNEGARAAHGWASSRPVIRPPVGPSIHHPRHATRGHLFPLLLHRLRSDATGSGVNTPGAHLQWRRRLRAPYGFRRTL